MAITLADMETRLIKIERVNRYLTIISALLLAGVLTCLAPLLGLTPAPLAQTPIDDEAEHAAQGTIPDTITARNFVVVDERGNETGRLGTSKDLARKGAVLTSHFGDAECSVDANGLLASIRKDPISHLTWITAQRLHISSDSMKDGRGTSIWLNTNLVAAYLDIKRKPQGGLLRLSTEPEGQQVWVQGGRPDYPTASLNASSTEASMTTMKAPSSIMQAPWSEKKTLLKIQSANKGGQWESRLTATHKGRDHEWPGR